MSTSKTEEENYTAALDSLKGWDDNLLVRAYGSSINLSKEDVAKRIATRTNSKSKSPRSILKEQGIKCGVGCGSSDDTNGDEEEEEEEEEQKFKLGDYVRATYDDQIDYEAKIINIDEIHDTCTVKYIGYENEQNVQLSNLIPSWGKKSRRMQSAKAKESQDMNSREKKHDKKPKTKLFQNQHQNLLNLNLASSFNQLPPPPPPPLPPMINELNDESEHISAMLMSWYMSGYYTGLYQGQKLNKQKKNNKKKQ